MTTASSPRAWRARGSQMARLDLHFALLRHPRSQGCRWSELQFRHLDLPYWRDGGRPFQITPAQVKADPARYQEQYKRTMVADLAHPLDLLFRNDRWVILDGVHRLLKADVLGLSQVRVRPVSAAMLPLIRQMTT